MGNESSRTGHIRALSPAEIKREQDKIEKQKEAEKIGRADRVKNWAKHITDKEIDECARYVGEFNRSLINNRRHKKTGIVYIRTSDREEYVSMSQLTYLCVEAKTAKQGYKLMVPKKLSCEEHESHQFPWTLYAVPTKKKENQ